MSSNDTTSAPKKFTSPRSRSKTVGVVNPVVAPEQRHGGIEATAHAPRMAAIVRMRDGESVNHTIHNPASTGKKSR